MINLKLQKLPLFVISAIVLLILIIFGAVKISHRNNNPIIPSTNPAASPSSGPAGSTSDASNQALPPSGSGQSSPSSMTGSPPLTPTGDFISNHHPGGDNPISEASVCNTSAGAICYIQFTKGSDVKKLDQRITDAKGAAYWYWDIKTAGLESGSWTVTAIAILNGQTKMSSDPQLLVVQ